eukprot:TRINITY_DN12255_c0_g4_i1.p1 TRINITY_DN12255_c0_g4~~TRINITY_DN12255_c0_g4_i1.p1  ORF type:complete len:418 (-),score=76.83 TRINITY_DN12255_c0_g4_i1:215-1468(-)
MRRSVDSAAAISCKSSGNLTLIEDDDQDSRTATSHASSCQSWRMTQVPSTECATSTVAYSVAGLSELANATQLRTRLLGDFASVLDEYAVLSSEFDLQDEVCARHLALRTRGSDEPRPCGTGEDLLRKRLTEAQRTNGSTTDVIRARHEVAIERSLQRAPTRPHGPCGLMSPRPTAVSAEKAAEAAAEAAEHAEEASATMEESTGTPEFDGPTIAGRIRGWFGGIFSRGHKAAPASGPGCGAMDLADLPPLDVDEEEHVEGAASVDVPGLLEVLLDCMKERPALRWVDVLATRLPGICGLLCDADTLRVCGCTEAAVQKLGVTMGFPLSALLSTQSRADWFQKAVEMYRNLALVEGSKDESGMVTNVLGKLDFRPVKVAAPKFSATTTLIHLPPDLAQPAAVVPPLLFVLEQRGEQL